MQRRTFIQQSAVTAAAGGFASAQGLDKKTVEPAVLGDGRFRYEVVEGWGAPPAGMNYQMGCALVADSRDRIYVHSQSQKAVLVFSRDGQLIADWGAEFAGPNAHGLYWSREGRDEFLYFSHLSNNIVKTDLNGKVLLRLGDVKEESPTQVKFKFNRPTDLAVAPNGDLYVCEGYGGNQVHAFNRDGKYLRTFGQTGTAHGQFRTPHGIWIDTRGGKEPEVYVADRANGRAEIFTLSGEYKRTLSDLRNPCCFYVHGEHLFVPDLAARVTVFDGHDQVVAQLGDGRGAPNPVNFQTPHALTLDSRGDLYVVEWLPDARLRKFHWRPRT